MATIPDEVAEEVLRQSELRLQAQIDLALAADLRSITFLGIVGGAAIVLVAAGAAVATSEKPNVPLAIAFFAGAIVLLVAAALSGRATMPVGFHIPGTRASLLEGLLETPLAHIKMEQARRNEERINGNDKVLTKNGKTMRLALFAAPASIPAAVAAYAVSIQFCR